ncbi:MAG: sulfatase [Verrucomicrobiota bacterium]
MKLNALFFALFTLFLFQPLFAESSPPNLVFIIADDCTFRDIGCYGGQAHTPNIDELATEGMRFERCFQAAPMCSPTRHNIYTGLYPVKSGAYPNHTFAYDHVKSIVHYLEPMGYRVALSGKTHIKPPEVFPFEMIGEDKSPDMEGIGAMMKESSESDQPFCLFVCSNEPHTPWNKGDASAYPPEDIVLPKYIVDTKVVRENFSKYLAEITYFDGEVGQVVGMLEEHGLSENTLVMVVSEQGNAFPFAKWTLYDHGLQAAMVVRWPGKVEAGSVANAMVEYVDVTPTFIDAAGGEAIDGLDGKSFLPVLEGETDHHKDFVYGIMTTRGIINGSEAFGIRSVRSEDYKLIVNLHHETKFTNALTKNDVFLSMVEKAEKGAKKARRLVDAYHHRPPLELYDVRADPLEQKNLAENPEYAEVIEELSAKLDEWMTEQGDLGGETEWKANERQGGNRKKKSNAKKGKPKEEA